MKTIEKPEMTLLETGKVFKLLKVKGLAGMNMPLHHSTKEAVIVVQKGKAFLKMPTATYNLVEGITFIIPAGEDHSLEIKEDFNAIAIMTVDSEIEFG